MKIFTIAPGSGFTLNKYKQNAHRYSLQGARLALMSLLIGGCALPRWPVAGTMTSPFGFRMRGWHPDFHNGVDVAAAEGAPVHAMKAGTVIRTGEMTGYGLAVILQHGKNTRTIYGHLSGIAVKQGEHVAGGSLIGSVGRTGNATGPHLHFEVWRYGHAEDPVPLLGGFPPPGGR
jgi:murein DD-endopeptidase MepM/ murein hydrolase activator NlpD